MNIEINVKNEPEGLQVALENYIKNEFNTSNDFLILDDDTRDEYAIEFIQESLWAFNSSWIQDFLKEGIELETDQIEKITGNLYEDANEIIKNITDWKTMIHDACSIDGHGHFLSSYNGGEYEFSYDGVDYYIYIQ